MVLFKQSMAAHHPGIRLLERSFAALSLARHQLISRRPSIHPLHPRWMHNRKRPHAFSPSLSMLALQERTREWLAQPISKLGDSRLPQATITTPFTPLRQHAHSLSLIPIDHGK
jgi:hypothetical protein